MSGDSVFYQAGNKKTKLATLIVHYCGAPTAQTCLASMICYPRSQKYHVKLKHVCRNKSHGVTLMENLVVRIERVGAYHSPLQVASVLQQVFQCLAEGGSPLGKFTPQSVKAVQECPAINMRVL